MEYPELSAELSSMLADDQRERLAQGLKFFSESTRLNQTTSNHNDQLSRASRLAKIIETVRIPLRSRIGKTGAEAVAVIALHADYETLCKVIAAFEVALRDHPDDVDRSLVPALYDWRAVLNRNPQLYGCMWFFDDHQQPYLYMTRQVDSVNSRRKAYDLAPLTWPRSLAIALDEQSWLIQPFSHHTMRWPSEGEHARIEQEWGGSTDTELPRAA